MGQKASAPAAKAPQAAAAVAAVPPPVRRTWFATVQCSICLEDVVLSASISCKNKHSCCKDCFAQYVQSTVENPGKLLDCDFNVPCPTPQCSACPWTHAELGTHLTKAQMNSFYDSIISISRNIMNHTEQDGGGGIKRNIVKGITESKLEEAVLSALNLTCPKCKVVLDQNPDGCSAMRCNGCGTHFCWLCFLICKNSMESHSHVRRCPAIEREAQRGNVFVPRHIVTEVHHSLRVKRIKKILSDFRGSSVTIAEEPEADAAPAAEGVKAAQVPPKEGTKNPKEELIKRVLKKLEPILKDIKIFPHQILGGNAPSMPQALRGRIFGAGAHQNDCNMLFLVGFFYLFLVLVFPPFFDSTKADYQCQSRDLSVIPNSSALEYGISGEKCLANVNQTGCAKETSGIAATIGDGTTAFVSFSEYAFPAKEENGGEAGVTSNDDSTGFSMIDVTGFKVGDQNFVRLSNGMFTNAADLEMVTGRSDAASSTATQKWSYPIAAAIRRSLRAAVSGVTYVVWSAGFWLVSICFKFALLLVGWCLLAVVMKQVDVASDICRRLYRCTGSVDLTRWRQELKPTEESKLVKGLEMSAVVFCALYIIVNYLW